MPEENQIPFVGDQYWGQGGDYVIVDGIRYRQGEEPKAMPTEPTVSDSEAQTPNTQPKKKG